MNEIVTINKSDVFFLKLTTPGKLYPRSLSTSEDGFLAILQIDSLIMSTIGCRPLSDDKRYILTQEVVEIDLNFSKSIINIADFNFEEAIKTHQIPNGDVYKLLLCENFTVDSESENRCKKFSSVDWSPLDTFFNKSYLAIMTLSGRVLVLSQNPLTNKWEKEFDLLELYHRHYQDNLLTIARDDSGVVNCASVHDYIRLKTDLQCTNFSWSCLVRQTRHNRYCLLALLSASGIVTLWRLVTDENGSRCESVFTVPADEFDGVPISIQFCDTSKTHFLVAVFLADHRIVAIPFSVGADITRNGSVITIAQSQLLGPLNRHAWSSKCLTLVVGYESELLLTKFTDSAGAGASFSSVARLPLASFAEISSIVVRGNVAYATSQDGHLFAVKLDDVIGGRYELREMAIPAGNAPTYDSNDEFLDAFVSPNGVQLGVLRLSGTRGHTRCDIALVRLLPLEELLGVLLDDYKPLARKQDAVEELRRTLAIGNEGDRQQQLKLRELAHAEAHWDASSLHSLQLARYLCMLPGISDAVGNRHIEDARLRRLEAIIVCRNISYRLDSFADLSATEVQLPDDCLFVAVLCARLARAVSSVVGGDDCQEIADAIDAARTNARTLLANEWGAQRADKEMAHCEAKARRFECPMCNHCTTDSAGVSCRQTSLLASQCPNGHVVALCCKTLEIVIDDSVKSCGICGALELWVDSCGLSNWRLGIINSNCPLCDGKFTKLQF